MANALGQLTKSVSGEFVTRGGERFYAIRNSDQMAPFFVSVVSDSDHWLFVSSTGGLTAGRVSPETALFPYEPVDKIYDSANHTGSKTLIKVNGGSQTYHWEPFNVEHGDRFELSRHLYKNLLGNKICFEEINHDLNLTFRYTWMTSDAYGFVRHAEIINTGEFPTAIEIVDGLQNVLPAGTPRFAQTNSSNLVDAYKWSELEESTGLAMYTLYSGITDRAEPCESLKANTVFSLGLPGAKVLLSNLQARNIFRKQPIQQESCKRGVRGAYLVYTAFDLPPTSAKDWRIVANLEHSQTQVTALIGQLKTSDKLLESVETSVAEGSDALARIMGAADGFQATDEENVSVHHYANVLFNVLRGGIFDQQYQIPSADFVKNIKMFNKAVFENNEAMLNELPDLVSLGVLLVKIQATADPQLERLCMEYLPITFGRRHGDPSRPWNQFAIKLKDDDGSRLLSYQGNWRDIFQNWEALSFSYPEFIESVIAKFVNASTVDGYNPYRITKEGIDWEMEEPDDPWSYIGYWGDHQIIYLLKLLEQSKKFHPSKLRDMLYRQVFCYANVPYRIKSFAQLVENPKDTVAYDNVLAAQIEERVKAIGSDGKLVLDDKGAVYQVNLLEKLLVPLLSKLSNLVLDGGIWLNTQRPEWNDANNALVGQGLSMVTLYYLRRYLTFMQELLANETEAAQLSGEVCDWLITTANILANVKLRLDIQPVSDGLRYETMEQLGKAGSDYRQKVYENQGFVDRTFMGMNAIKELLANAMVAVDHSIAANERKDGLYHAYNLLSLKDQKADVENLYAMLEGQVAILSSGGISPAQAANVVENLFASDVYRKDQHTFMLYPDRSLLFYLNKNCVPREDAEQIPVIKRMLAIGDRRLIESDEQGTIRFDADLKNSGALKETIYGLSEDYPEIVESQAEILALYEKVFNHKAFTGRSGGMFGFEGLGCIYWHMVSKMLLAVQENFFRAVNEKADPAVIERLGNLYYKVRYGIGFNKSPQEYGAFPTDPYSHTPGHAGAQQPGMTGQVKEEVLSRFGELGIHVENGAVRFNPALLRTCEFATDAKDLKYLDVHENWQRLEVQPGELGFTWCQVPILYRLVNDAQPSIEIVTHDGNTERSDVLELSTVMSQQLFRRTGMVTKIVVSVTEKELFN